MKNFFNVFSHNEITRGSENNFSERNKTCELKESYSFADVKKLIQSFGCAIQGIFTALKEQQNMRVHFLAMFVVVAAGIFFRLSKIEWSIVALAIGLVIVTELLNTAIEMLVDLVSPEYNEQAGKIKDVAAGAVLLSAVVAVMVAVFIFGNKIFNLLL